VQLFKSRFYKCVLAIILIKNIGGFSEVVVSHVLIVVF